MQRGAAHGALFKGIAPVLLRGPNSAQAVCNCVDVLNHKQVVLGSRFERRAQSVKRFDIFDVEPEIGRERMDQARLPSSGRTVEDDAELPWNAAGRVPLFGAEKPREARDESILDRLIDENGVESALAPAKTAVASRGGIQGNVD